MITNFKIFENNKFKVGDYAIMKHDNKRVKVIGIEDNSLWIDYDGYPMEFLSNGFITELEYNAKKYNL